MNSKPIDFANNESTENDLFRDIYPSRSSDEKAVEEEPIPFGTLHSEVLQLVQQEMKAGGIDRLKDSIRESLALKENNPQKVRLIYTLSRLRVLRKEGAFWEEQMKVLLEDAFKELPEGDPLRAYFQSIQALVVNSRDALVALDILKETSEEPVQYKFLYSDSSQ